MISVWHLLWIVPVSAITGALALVCFVCLAVNKGADDAEEMAELMELKKRMEEDTREHEEI